MFRPTYPYLVILMTFLLSALLEGCLSTHGGIVAGQTTAYELQKILGEPDSISVPSELPRARIYYFSNGDSYHVEAEVVRTIYRLPASNESHIQVFLQKWSGEKKIDRNVQYSNVHTLGLKELSVPELGRSVVYELATGKVKQVVEYAPE